MIVTICGSMRHIHLMFNEYKRLSLEGYLVFLPVVMQDSIISDDLKEQLKQLHFKKISLSQFIYVVNPNGYIGESTMLEIEYAKKHNIPIKYFNGSKST